MAPVAVANVAVHRSQVQRERLFAVLSEHTRHIAVVTDPAVCQPMNRNTAAKELRVEQNPIAFFALPQRLLCPLALGNVFNDSNVGLFVYLGSDDPYPNGLAIFADVALIHFVGLQLVISELLIQLKLSFPCPPGGYGP